MKKISDLVLRMQPYAPEIKELCRLDSDFTDALKSLRSERFISLGAIITSRAYSTHSPKDSDQDEIIGVLVYDSIKNIFKQDFIVNVEKKYKEFRIYSRYKGVNKSKMIRDITHFYSEYPMYSKDSHHPTFENIPEEIRPRAIAVVELSKKLLSLGGARVEISDAEYKKFDEELCQLGL